MRFVGVARAFLLATLVLASSTLAQAPQAWDELAGTGARTGAAFLPSTTLDVLEHRDLFGNDTYLGIHYSKGLVATPHGLLALGERGDACILLRVAADGTVHERVLDACEDGTLTAYDRANDRLLVCSSGGPEDRIFQSRDASTGALVWGLRPVDLGLGGNEPILWRCGGTAVDRDQNVAYVAIWSSQYVPTPIFPGSVAKTTRIVRVQLADGDVDWDRTLAAANFQGGGSRWIQVNDASGGFTPYGLSITDNGLVVSGRTSCACGKGDALAYSDQQGAVAWLQADDGDLVGAALAEDDPHAMEEGVPTRFLGQHWATTQGPLAAFLLGERMRVVNPAEHEPVRNAPFPGIETGPGFIGVIPSAWWSNTIVVPVARSVTAVDAVTLAPDWSWTAGNEWVVSALLVLPPSDVLVLAVRPVQGVDGEAVLHRLDLKTGHELQSLPLPHTIPMPGGTGRARFQPLDDGTLLLYALDGGLFRLGLADPASRPRVSVSDAYPPAGAPVTLSVVAPREDANYTVAWGDGALEDDGTTWTHRYGGDGTRTARVTATFTDGRTATSEVLVRVGATPPATLTPLQRAFAPENQDLTFGILGLAATAGGGGLALLARRRRHGRLRHDLSALDGIRERGRQDPEGAVLALGTLREKFFGELEAGRVDDAHFQTVDARADAVFAILRTRLLGPLAGRLTADFRHALDVVLHDGRVDEDELAALRAALEEERHVTPEERVRLLGLLERLGRTP